MRYINITNNFYITYQQWKSLKLLANLMKNLALMNRDITLINIGLGDMS